MKDSGKRMAFSSGMVRDTTEDKIDWSLVADGPMLRRWAVHMTLGAQKYDKRNWLKGAGIEEYERHRESAYRHFMQWYYGESDEDHAAAVFFNINGAERLGSWKEIVSTVEKPSSPTSIGASALDAKKDFTVMRWNRAHQKPRITYSETSVDPGVMGSGYEDLLRMCDCGYADCKGGDSCV
jgi:hypothetical protein